jgi:hypothetical protein
MADPTKKGEQPPDEKRDASGDEAALPAIDFSTFLLSLSTSALYHLGLANDADGSLPEPNLPLAKQSIDILALLREKTRGNLTADEAQLLDSLLYDLRLSYVNATRRR